MLLYIILGNEHQPAGRMLAAELLAKLQSDKLNGGKWTRLMIQFLPPVFADLLQENPCGAYENLIKSLLE